jgi:hypothetical protein
MPPSNTKTVVEDPGNSLAFMPSIIGVTEGTTLKPDNVSDTAQTFTVTGQGVDVQTQRGGPRRSRSISRPAAPFICRFDRSLAWIATAHVKA